MKDLNIVKNKKLYFLISGLVIIPGLISLVLFGLKLSIDFTGGSKIEYQTTKSFSTQQIKSAVEAEKIKYEGLQRVSDNSFIVRTESINQAKKNEVTKELAKFDSKIKEKSFTTVGPTIGAETELNALKAVGLASIAIMLYIAFAFRKVSKPVASWKYGLCAIAALLHDILIVVGVFSILGWLLGVEIDSLFITALLTVMGFSVHDTIVVFDRIRENLSKNYNTPFEDVVNHSLLETLNRSLNTSFTVIIVLFTLLLFGGESIRWFAAALLIGIVSGTYSSIFNASQLLIVWYEWDKKHKSKAK